MGDTEIAQAVASLGTNLSSFLPLIKIVAAIVGLVFGAMGLTAFVKDAGVKGRGHDGVRHGIAGLVIGVILLSIPFWIDVLAQSSGLDPRGDIFGTTNISAGDLVPTVKKFIDVVMAIVGSIAIIHGFSMIYSINAGSAGHNASFRTSISFILGGLAAIYYQPIIEMIVYSIKLPALTNIYNLVFGSG